MRVERLTLAGLALVAAHFIYVAAFHEPAVAGPDASGYFAQAKMLATQGQTYQEPASPLAFVGAHWLDAGDGRYYSKYPPGFPLLLAVPYALIGPTASLWVDPLLASLTLLGLLLLCRPWLGPGWALVATALMATNPLVNLHAAPGFSHTAVAFLLVWGIYALARWTREDSWRWLALAGLCVGLVPTARYAEVLYVGAFALYVGLHLRLHLRQSGRTGREALRRALPGAAAAALPMALLALRNQLAFGAFWRTAYAISGEQTGFGLGHFAQHWASYLEALGGGGVGLLFGLGVVGMALLVAAPDTRLRGALLVALLAPTTLLYMAYYWGGDDMSQRFLLPTYYLYAVAGVWLLKLLADHLGRPALAAAVAVLVLALPWGLSRSTQQLVAQGRSRRALVAVTDSLEQHVPNGAVVLADRTLGAHLDVVSPWRIGHAEALLNPDEGPRGPGPGQRPGMPWRGREGGGGRPDPMAGGARQRQAKYRDFPAAERRQAVLADLKSWAGPGGRAYLLIGDDGAEPLLADLGVTWESVCRIELPELEYGGDRSGLAPGVAPGMARAAKRGLGQRAMEPGMMRPGMDGPPMGGRGMAHPGGGPFGAAPSGPLLLVELRL